MGEGEEGGVVGDWVANLMVCFSSVVLWISQNMEDEYSYNLSL